MKLVRYGHVGEEKPGLIDATGVVRDLSAHVSDITPDLLEPTKLKELSAVNPQSLAPVENVIRFGVPFAATRQFLAIGLNYSDHAAETGQATPAEPIIFTKAVSCIQGANDDIRKPRGSTRMDWEVELGIVIGKRASYVSSEEALDHVAGYVICDDLSERQFQLERGGTWDKGKGCDTFGPVGPWLVTKDEVGDVQNLNMWLTVNGKRMQSGNTRTMIFDCATIVSYVSQFLVLQPADIITTGTPPGVGMGMKPPVYLQEGDVVELGIEKLGTQKHTIKSWNHGL